LGFSSIGAFMMMFFGLIIIVSTIVIIQTNLLESASIAYEEGDRLTRVINSRFDILNISYEDATDPDTTTMYVQNTGAEKLLPGDLDIFIDEIYIPKMEANRTIEFASVNKLNPMHWDPDEVLKIDIFIDLANVTHVVTLSNPDGVKDRTYYLG